MLSSYFKKCDVTTQVTSTMASLSNQHLILYTGFLHRRCPLFFNYDRSQNHMCADSPVPTGIFRNALNTCDLKDIQL
jgi:hypothetical protein